jgi:hypothetical protein
MADPHVVQSTCRTLYREKVILDVGPRQGGRIDPVRGKVSQSDYLLLCAMNALPFLEQRERTGERLRFWTPTMIQQIARFARAHGLRLAIYGPETTTHALGGRIIVSGQELQLTLVTHSFWEEEHLTYALDHELGHVRDHMRLARRYPEIKKLLQSGAMSLEASRSVLRAYFDLIGQQLTGVDQTEFIGLANTIFGRPSRATVGNMRVFLMLLSEALRYGEEVRDPRLRRFILSRDFDHLKKRPGVVQQKAKPRPGVIDLGPALSIALIQEAGLWKKYRRLPNIDHRLIESVDAQHIHFFRLAIRGASRIFSDSR